MGSKPSRIFFFATISGAILLLLSTTLFLFATPTPIKEKTLKETADSLHALLPAADNGGKISIYNQLSEYYRFENQLASLDYASRALRLSRESGDREAMATSLVNLGEYYLNNGDYAEALGRFTEALHLNDIRKDQVAVALSMSKIGVVYYYTNKYNVALMYELKALKIYEQVGMNTSDAANALNVIAYLYGEKAFYQKALEHHLKALKIRQNIGKVNEIAKSFNSIGDFYLQQGNLVKALEHYTEAYRTTKSSNNKRGIGISLNNMAVVYHRQGNQAKALELLQASLSIKQELGNQKDLAISLHNLGLVYHRMTQYHKALDHFHKALKIRDALRDRSHVTTTLTAMAHVYASMGDFKQALAYHERALHIAQALHLPSLLMESYDGIADTYLRMDDSKNFLKYYKQFLLMKDSLAQKLTSAQIIQMQQSFENEKTNNEIARLQQEKQIQALELKRQTMIQRLLLLLVGLIALVAGLIYKFYRLKRNSTRSLEEQNFVIMRQNYEFATVNQELQELNNKLSESEAKLRQLNSSKDKFFSIISHDLRGPIASLSAFLGLMSGSADMITAEEFKSMLGELQTSMRNVSVLLNNLLKWSRTQMGSESFEPERLVLSEVVSKTVSLLALNARSKDISIDSDIDRELVVYADVNMLEFIIRNLISNAIKFTFRGGIIMVSAMATPNHVTLSIADTGKGIPANIRERLFEPSQRVTTPGTEYEIGTGLGLILCKEFIDRHKGEIRVKENQPRGTIFEVFLPLPTGVETFQATSLRMVCL